MFKCLTNRWASGEDSKITERQVLFIRFDNKSKALHLKMHNKPRDLLLFDQLLRCSEKQHHLHGISLCSSDVIPQKHGLSKRSFHPLVVKRLLNHLIVGELALLFSSLIHTCHLLCSNFLKCCEDKKKKNLSKSLLENTSKSFTTQQLQIEVPTTFSCPF